MKKLRFIIALLLVLIMTVSFPAAALAAEYTAVDWGTFEDAFTATENDITITLENNILLEGVLTAGIGKKIVINGQTYVLKNVAIVGGADEEGGQVTINGNVEGTANTDALTVSDKVTVNVNGNVTGGNNINDGGTAGSGIVASENATVEVTGAVSGGNNTAVDGTAGTGAETSGQATVKVTGTVSGGDNTGVSNTDSSTGGTGIAAEDNSKVSVTGSVEGGDSTLTDAQLAYNEKADGGEGAVVSNNATVTVTGNVDGGDGAGHNADGGTGAEVNDAAKLNVGGSVSGGDVEALPSATYTEAVAATPAIDADKGAGAGLYVEPEAVVKVAGDVTGGSSDTENAGDGIILLTVAPAVTKPGNVNVGGTVEGGTSDNAKADDGAAIYLKITTGVSSLSTGNAATVTAWSVSDESGKMVEASEPTMLDEAKEYVAESTVYTVKAYQPKNGKLSVSPTSGVAGTKVTVKVTWDKDANLTHFKGIYYGNGKAKEIAEDTYEFYIPTGGGVQVYAAFNAPKTGDSANLCLWLGLVLASSAALAYPLLRRKKEQ